MADPFLFLQNLGLTLLLGSVIGLERERNHHAQTDRHEFGGIRTLALISVFGYLSYALFQDSVLFVVMTTGLILLLVASYVMSAYWSKSTGATTELAGLFTYCIGVLMAQGESLIATVITLLVVLILYFKEAIHRFAYKVEKAELYDTLAFIAIVFIVLPLLPDQSYGPLDVLNPYEIWLLVIFISSISFASYIAIKVIGPKKGIGLGGFLGGLMSSTAVSMSFSALSRKSQRMVNPFVFGIVIASSAMFFRILFTISVLNNALLGTLLIPLGVAGLAGLGFALYYWFVPGKGTARSLGMEDIQLESPFKLRSALQFGVLFAGLLFISKFASDYFGSQGVYVTSFFSGLFDVDAITVSMAELHKEGLLDTEVASQAILIAAFTNTLSKGGIVLAFASRKVAVRTVLALVLLAVLGLSAYGFVAL